MRITDLGFGAKAVLTDSTDGDLLGGDSGDNLLSLRRSILNRPWVTINQIHSDIVLSAGLNISDDVVLGPGDAVVTENKSIALGVFVADCGNIGLVGDNQMKAAVHCGWRGLENEILQKTVNILRSKGAEKINAVIGPNIGPECYEFQKKDMAPLIDRYGPEAQSVTSELTPSLNIPYIILSILSQYEVNIVYRDLNCTKCSGKHFSYRKDATDKRQVLAVYFED